MRTIFVDNKSFTGQEILDWCMKHQTNKGAIDIYRIYFSKNAVRPVSLSKYYFAIRDKKTTGREAYLKRDRKRKPDPIVHRYKIPMRIDSNYMGYIVVASTKHPRDLYNIFKLKNYRREIKSENLKLFLGSKCHEALLLSEYPKPIPKDKLFIITEIKCNERID